MSEMKRIERPKFFFPYAKDASMGEEEWRKLRDRYGTTEQRIYRLRWEHKNVIHEAEVGKQIQQFPEPAGPVIAIIRGHQCFMVFTAFRGILRDVPVIVGNDEYIEHVEFDANE
jgi:hypothetical protein